MHFMVLPLHYPMIFMQDNVFPDNIALPIGGPHSNHYAIIEMHYDNPKLKEG